MEDDPIGLEEMASQRKPIGFAKKLALQVVAAMLVSGVGRESLELMGLFPADGWGSVGLGLGLGFFSAMGAHVAVERRNRAIALENAAIERRREAERVLEEAERLGEVELDEIGQSHSALPS